MLDRNAEWHRKAKELYFNKHLQIVDIAYALNKTRQTVSAFLNSLPEWNAEQEYRRTESKRRRKIQKRLWETNNRVGINLKREHEMAVAELSAEKYH